ncbi:hypothetical protein JCM8097_002945 [Rhodosporidiobolus ruineniae]
MAVLLENALSEELPAPPSPPPPASSSAPHHDRISTTPQPRPPAASDKDKMLAACVGAVLTSLTMTPFDVIKTRLQTAPSASSHAASAFSSASSPPASTPPSHLPPSHPYSHPVHTPFPPPVASTSAAATTAPGRTGGSLPPHSSAPAAHHHPSSSSTSELLHRFDPRVARSALPAAGAHGALSPTAVLHLSALSSSSSSSSSSAALSLPASLHPPPRAPSAPRSGFIPTVLHIARTEGPSALWRGTAPALAMSVPGQVVYMLGYDWGRREAFARAPQWARKGGKEGGAGRGELRAGYVTAVPLLAGAASRTLVAALLSPFELVRTQLQAQTSSSRVPLRRLVNELEWRNAWRGLGPTLWRDVPFSGVYWAGYEGFKRALTGGRGMGEAAAAGGAEETLASRLGLGEFGVAFVSGAGSGMLAATLTNPFDVIKTRRQALSTSPSSASSSSSAATQAAKAESTRTLPLLRQIFHDEGVAGLFRGLTPRLAKVGPACGLMIGCYEALSSFSSASRAAASSSSSSSSSHAAAE